MLYRDTVVIAELLQHVQPFLLADGQWQCSVGVQSTLCSVTAAAAGTGLKPPGLLSWRTCLWKCILDPRAEPLNNNRAGRGGSGCWGWICTGSGKVNYSSRGPWHLRAAQRRGCKWMCSWSRCGLAHPVSGIAVTMTQVNEGFLVKRGKAQQGQNQKWLHQATAQYCTPALLPCRTVQSWTKGTQWVF